MEAKLEEQQRALAEAEAASQASLAARQVPLLQKLRRGALLAENSSQLCLASHMQYMPSAIRQRYLSLKSQH